MSEQLLRIKQHRESSAANEVVRCRRYLDQCAMALEQAIRTVADYGAWRRRREDELFEAVRGQLIRLAELETLNMNVGLLREREAVLRNEVLEARKIAQDAESALGEAKQQHLIAVRAVEKFEIFVDIQRQLERQEQQRREESALEEFAPRRPALQEEPET